MCRVLTLVPVRGAVRVIILLYSAGFRAFTFQLLPRLCVTVRWLRGPITYAPVPGRVLVGTLAFHQISDVRALAAAIRNVAPSWFGTFLALSGLNNLALQHAHLFGRHPSPAVAAPACAPLAATLSLTGQRCITMTGILVYLNCSGIIRAARSL